MGGYSISPELYEAKEEFARAKQEEWACFRREDDSIKQIPLDGKLREEVYKTYDKIKIKSEKVKSIQTIWNDGKSSPIEVPHKVYTASFPELNSGKWNPLVMKQWHPLIWAASHRCTAKPGDIEWEKDSKGNYYVSNTMVFEEQMKIDTLGLMGELFLCKLFDWSLDDFWHNFCKYAGKGDDDWDILIKTAPPTQYYVDAKVRVKADSSSWNIGEGKFKGKLLAPIEQREESGKYIFTFSRLIDVETFWDTADKNLNSPFLHPDKEKRKTRYFFESSLTYDLKPRYESEYKAEVLDRWQLLAFKCMDETSYNNVREIEKEAYKKSKEVNVIDC